VIFLNSAVCTLILLLSFPKRTETREIVEPNAEYGLLIRKAVALGLVVTALSTLAEWGVTRAIYGNEFAGGGKPQIRFGANATATAAKPQPGQPHP
jgi:Na+/alanine symporter